MYATHIVHQLVNPRRALTSYSHEAMISEEEFRCNCYGFVNHLIKRSHELAFGDLLTHMKELTLQGIEASFEIDKPSPYNFFHIFTNLYENKLTSPYWRGIKDIITLEAGDLLVYLPLNLGSSPKFHKPSLTKARGTHIMIVSAILSKAHDVMEIKIIDSTHHAHNTVDDTRHLYNIKGGVGESFLFIKKTEQEGIYHLKWGEKMQGYTKKLFAGRPLFPESK